MKSNISVFEKVIADYKSQTGKLGNLTEREMKLIEICYYHFSKLTK